MKTCILYYLVSMLAVGVHAKETIMCELCPDGITDGRGNVIVPEYHFMTCSQVIEEIPSVESVSKEDLFRHMGGEESIFPLSCDFYYYEIKAYCCPEMLPVESPVSIVNYQYILWWKQGHSCCCCRGCCWSHCFVSARDLNVAEGHLQVSKLPRCLILKESIRSQKEVLL